MAGFILIVLALIAAYLIIPWWGRHELRKRRLRRTLDTSPGYTVVPVMLFKGAETSGEEAKVISEALSIAVPEGAAPFSFEVCASGRPGRKPTIVESSYTQPSGEGTVDCTGRIVTAIRTSLGDRAVVRPIVSSDELDLRTREHYERLSAATARHREEYQSAARRERTS
jgi:hypothetical protein